MQLNAVGQLKRYLGKKELEVIATSFVKLLSFSMAF